MDIRKYLTGTFITLDDLRDGPRRERIVSVAEGKFDKPVLKFESGDMLTVNATNMRVLMRAFGPETDDWVGKEIEVYIGEVEWQGKPQEGVRVKPITPTEPAKANLVPDQHAGEPAKPAKSAKRSLAKADAGKAGDMDDEIPF